MMRTFATFLACLFAFACTVYLPPVIARAALQLAHAAHAAARV